MVTSPAADKPSEEIAARLSGITKSFGATHALRGIDLDIPAGEIHALVGENGAGKSTALGILAGRIGPTSGRVDVFGEELRYGDPRASHRAGIVAIYQELTIIPALGAEANVFLGQSLSSYGFLRNSAMRRRYLELCAEAGVTGQPPGIPAAAMSVAEQQMLEILRGIASQARILLFDEPTASLGEAERDALFALMRDLRSRGITVVLVSHNLDEVMAIADRITVFRDGALVRSGPTGSWSKQSLVTSMLGDVADDRMLAEMLDSEQQAARPQREHGEELLRATDVTLPGVIEDIELSVRAGEVLGIAGLVGSGRSTLLRALAGLEPKSSGRLWVRGKEVPWPKTVRQAHKVGIALLPEDRKSQGLVLGLSAMENVVMSDLPSVARAGMVTPKAMHAAAAAVAPDFGFAVSRLRTHAGQLSGGNQQKLLLARWKHSPPLVLLADEPTRGIDIGAKDEITKALEAMVAEGLGVILVSSELAEVASISDRVLVLAGGHPAGELDSLKGEITVSEILHEAFAVGADS
ncbi:MAG: sugar ABC transporter ATP-binding protein [Nocardioidaceae bacterium]|nr:MAG: sugar ABC transporter ATP-binding protein [Nocardioidaceae bacterium]